MAQAPAHAQVPSGRIWPDLLPELSERIAAFLEGNEVACTLRLVNRAAAAQFRGPQHTAVRLSQPVPRHAFARRWGAPGATRGMPYKQRLQLLCLTAASGVIPNLEVAVGAAGRLLTREVMETAAAAGRRDACKWLLRAGCPADYLIYLNVGGALFAAAEAGQQGICEWLIREGRITKNGSPVVGAARGGHVGLMEWLLREYPQHFGPPEEWYSLLAAVAKGYDLATLQRTQLALQQAAGNGSIGQRDVAHITDSCVCSAASSRTPDWRAKVERLLPVGRRLPVSACLSAACCADALERLVWLRQRGCPLDTWAADAAARRGDLPLLRYLHAEGVRVGGAAREAARHGRMEVVAWALDTPGVGAAMDAALFRAAAESGSLELLTWLHERGCPWGGENPFENPFTAAADGGNELALEWLAERGCIMGDDGDPYVQAAHHNDVATLRCLVRLGCPWGPVGRVLKEAAYSVVASRTRWAMLVELLDAGCPVGCPEAGAVVRAGGQGLGSETEEANALLRLLCTGSSHA